jgi:transcriptional regulator with XRE-family HTH domain
LLTPVMGYCYHTRMIKNQWRVNGKWIATIREIHGLSQVELASMLRITKQAVSNLEREDRQPSTRTILRIANLFGVDPTKIFQKEVPPPSVGE